MPLEKGSRLLVQSVNDDGMYHERTTPLHMTKSTYLVATPDFDVQVQVCAAPLLRDVRKMEARRSIPNGIERDRCYLNEDAQGRDVNRGSRGELTALYTETEGLKELYGGDIEDAMPKVKYRLRGNGPLLMREAAREPGAALGSRWGPWRGGACGR